ncbi:hypothetical protein Y1Q_0013238 [Alligator mississippiensis]|uniref:Uncharacterized protein n=1 Tax=Alligator mississippiensis TaxID=8496 RepID=A0A151NUK4_ALLMI|nr:hypothetical protein Y1Q_0013238 [Alligator mississippiensis]
MLRVQNGAGITEGYLRLPTQSQQMCYPRDASFPHGCLCSKNKPAMIVKRENKDHTNGYRHLSNLDA